MVAGGVCKGAILHGFFAYPHKRVAHAVFWILPARMQAVQTRSVLCVPSTTTWTRRRLGFQRRLVTLCAWLMLFPYLGPLPQMSQLIAIPTPRLSFGRKSIKKPIIAKKLQSTLVFAGYKKSFRVFL